MQPADFNRVFRGGRKSGCGSFTVLALVNEKSHPRLGLAVAKRAVRRAVARNRLKRLIRESFRNGQRDLGGLDLVVLCKPGAARMSNADVRAALETHWRRLVARGRASAPPDLEVGDSTRSDRSTGTSLEDPPKRQL